MDLSEVILVNESDQPTGTMEKMQAHIQGLLHRAFSVFIFNKQGEMLLQQRSDFKYHSPGLWTNACCSHPAPGENTLAAASRRLSEELGFTTGLTELFSFIYKASFDNGLTEHEYDHVFVGIYEEEIHADLVEVKGHQYLSLKDIASDLQTNPQTYTVWFRIAFPRVESWAKTELEQHLKKMQ